VNYILKNYKLSKIPEISTSDMPIPDIDNKKLSFECEQKFEIEPEIVHKIVTLTIFTFVKGIKLILSGKDTRTLMYKNKIFVNAVEMYKKRLKIKNF
jgi:hypothetical protein